MADKAPQSTLGEFLKQATDRLAAGEAVPPEDVVAQGETYAPFRKFLAEHSKELAEVLAANPDRQPELLGELLSRAQQLLTTLPQLSETKGGATFPGGEQQVIPSAVEIESRKRAIRGATESLVERRRELGRKQAKFARKVAQAWVPNLTEQARNRAAEEFSKSLAEKPPEGNARQAIETTLREAFVRFPEGDAKLREAPESFTKSVASALVEDPLDAAIWRENRAAAVTARIALQNPEIRRVDVIADRVVQELTKNPAIPDEPLSQVSAMFARAADVFSSSVEPAPGEGVSFFDLAKTPFQKAAGWALDAVGSILPGGAATKEAVMKGIFAESLEKGVDEFTRRFGQEVVNQEWFQRGLQQTNDVLSQREAASAIASGIGKLFSDAAHSVFTGVPDEEMRAILVTMHENPHTSWDQMYLARVYAQNPHAGHFAPPVDLLDLGQWLFRRGTKRAAEAAVGKVATEGAKKLTLAVAIKTAAASILKIVTGPIGWVIGFVVQPILRFLGKLVGGLLSGKKAPFGIDAATTGILDYARSALGGAPPTPPKPWHEREWVYIAGLIVLPVFVVYLLVAQAETTRSTALFESLQPAVGGEGPFVPPEAFGDLACLLPTNLSASQQNKVAEAIKAYPSLGLYNCVLDCSNRKINLTARNYNTPELYYGFAPSWNRGNIFFYLAAFTSLSSRGLAGLIAHELAHQVNWFHWDILDAFLHGTTTRPKGYCGPLGTYRFVETGYETFAEAAAMYITGEPYLGQKCPQAQAFMERLFSSCRK